MLTDAVATVLEELEPPAAADEYANDEAMRRARAAVLKMHNNVGGGGGGGDVGARTDAPGRAESDDVDGNRARAIDEQAHVARVKRRAAAADGRASTASRSFTDSNDEVRKRVAWSRLSAS